MSDVTDQAWHPLAEPPSLGMDEVHVWHFPIGNRNCDPALLSAEERQRAGKFAFPHLRARYVDAHVQLRRLLGHYLGVSPAGIEFAIAERGKPRLPGGDWHFNLTHTDEHALVAVTRLAEIGVDVECLDRKIDRDGIAERFFSPAEAAELRDLPASEQPEGFFHLWTRKEAWLKATGVGISEGLNKVEFNCRPGEAPLLLRLDGRSEGAAGWLVHSLRPLPGHVGAVVLRAGSCRLRTFRLEAAG